jgi:hypothetical protein
MNMNVMEATSSQNAGTRCCSGLNASHSVTTTMKIDMHGYATITSVTDSGTSWRSSPGWIANTQATAASASAAMRPSRATLDRRCGPRIDRREKPSSPAANSAYPGRARSSGRRGRLALRSPRVVPTSPRAAAAARNSPIAAAITAQGHL